jgi:hypothetical protein
MTITATRLTQAAGFCYLVLATGYLLIMSSTS